MADHDTPKPDETRDLDLSPDLDATQNNEKLETIIEKEEKSTRTPTGAAASAKRPAPAKT